LIGLSPFWKTVKKSSTNNEETIEEIRGKGLGLSHIHHEVLPTQIGIPTSSELP